MQNNLIPSPQEIVHQKSSPTRDQTVLIQSLIDILQKKFDWSKITVCLYEIIRWAKNKKISAIFEEDRITLERTMREHGRRVVFHPSTNPDSDNSYYTISADKHNKLQQE